MKGAIKRSQLVKAMPPHPKSEWFLLEREAGVTLAELTNVGVRVQPNWGREEVLVEFSPLGHPFKWGETGWTVQRLQSNYGGKCLVLVETDTKNRVSGLLRLHKPKNQRRKR